MSRKDEKGKVGKGSEISTDSVSEPGSKDCGSLSGKTGIFTTWFYNTALNTLFIGAYFNSSLYYAAVYCIIVHEVG